MRSPARPTMRKRRRAPWPAHAPGVLQPLVAADDTQPETFAHAIAHEEALRPHQFDPPSGQPVRKGCRPLLDPQQARQVPGLDVVETRDPLKDHRGAGHPVDAPALDQVHDAVCIEPLQEDDRVPGQEVVRRRESDGVIERPRDEHQLWMRHRAIGLQHGRRIRNRRRIHHSGSLDDDDLGGPGRTRAADATRLWGA